MQKEYYVESMTKEQKIIFCTGCGSDVSARLTDGSEIYPHRQDLYRLPFWRCDTCKNFVGCHHKTKDKTRPLGVIPTKEIKEMRKIIHAVLDPLWQSKKIPRRKLYAQISSKIGKTYHTADIKSVAEAKTILSVIRELSYT